MSEINFLSHRPSKLAEAARLAQRDGDEPDEVIPAFKRAFAENGKGRPSYLEFIASQHPVHGGWVGR